MISSTSQSATFRFYAELNDFLPPPRRQKAFNTNIHPPVSVKHLIEALGVPHTEVEVILANGESVDFAYLVQPADRLSIYPAFTSLDVTPLVPLRPPLPQPPSFVLDVHLGQLAMFLRLLGFDTLYPNNHYDDAYLAQIAHEQQRVMLTRDRGLLKRSLVVHGYCLRSRSPEEQLAAVLHRFHLYEWIQPWQRCLKCNGRLKPTPKSQILPRLEPKTSQYYDEFYVCQECHQIYWKGSHYDSLKQIVERYT
ncbi:MAG: Mut7-C ubiquitin/RNAse domain-containing protein [Ardenticatenaceae bacterium]|nr:Mut7-C ubiquitin/RNAse domain-containing protein [Ardenticatenaceae bacterium]